MVLGLFVLFLVTLFGTQDFFVLIPRILPERERGTKCSAVKPQPDCNRVRVNREEVPAMGRWTSGTSRTIDPLGDLSVCMLRRLAQSVGPILIFTVGRWEEFLNNADAHLVVCAFSQLPRFRWRTTGLSLNDPSNSVWPDGSGLLRVPTILYWTGNVPRGT